MGDRLKILCCQLNPVIGDLDGNTAKILKALTSARTEGADVVLFPELTLCGYPPDDLVHHDDFVEKMEQHLSLIAEGTRDLMVFVGLVRRNLSSGDKPHLNSVAVLKDGGIVGFYDKWLLPTYDVFNERRYFEPGNSLRLWEHQGKSIGVLICEDIWQHAGYTSGTRYTRDPVEELKALKPDVLLNLSASPYQFQKPEVRVEVCSKAAKTLGCPVILCCQVGANGQIIFDGYSVHVDKEGSLCQLGKGFEEDELLIDLDHPHCDKMPPYYPMDELFSALVLGVRDYFRKCGFKKACLGMSGGIDSALVACIAAKALGPENVLAVSMPSEYTSPQSIIDAKQMSENLGLPFLEIPIQEKFELFLSQLEPFFESPKWDVTEENLQARIRGMILMALSNKNGHIVLATGNKSEIALGYSTLYGDMCGGLGVIADVTKTMVYQLSRHMNLNGELIPQSIIDKPPSAELRPNQMDLDSLPEYGIVDQVLTAYVEDYLSPELISKKYHIPIQIVRDLAARVHRAEYKRRQGPPILRVSKKAFGVGRKYPLVQKWI